MTLAVETRGLTRRYGRLDAVDALDLRVPAGSIFAIVGPNGAGKTTTIKMLMNLVRPTRGAATILGVDSRRLAWRDFQRVGYVSENQNLPEWMTAAELLAYCRPLYPTWDEALARRLQASLHLPPDVPLSKQSRGGRMKAALLSALPYRPDLVVLDEPFSGLDPLAREELTQALLELQAERPYTILVSSHDLDEIERLATWIAFIDRGRLHWSESVSGLLQRFQRTDGTMLSLREIFLLQARAADVLPAAGESR